MYAFSAWFCRNRLTLHQIPQLTRSAQYLAHVSDPLPHQVVAANVRAELARRRLTGVAVARELGLTQPAMSRRLTGDVPFTAVEVWRLSQILDVPIESLFNGT